MLIIFFDINRIVGKVFVLAGQTDNSAYYCDVLQQLRENVQRLCSKLWRQKNWLLHHDNALSHTSFFTREFLTKNNITVVIHPPYSPDLAPCDFSHFSSIEDETESLPFLTQPR
jgi:hypothetical protein